MTIRIFPSRLPGEPLETHHHQRTTIHDWLLSKVADYRQDMKHPIVLEVNGNHVPSHKWDRFLISSDDDVRMYPVAYGLETGTIIAIVSAVISAASVAYSLIMLSKMQQENQATSNGDQLDLSPAKANTAKLGSPIREVLGRYRVYPDYLMQPVSRFDPDNPKIYRSNLFLSVGMGNLSIPQSGMRLGNTPLSSFGDDISYTIYPPGADVSGDERTENWFVSTEVGNTTSGTAGLDLNSTGPETVSITADGIAVSGANISIIGESSSDEDDVDDSVIPESWTAGTVITARIPDTFLVVNEGGYAVIYGDLGELAAYNGMPVTLIWGSNEYELNVSEFSPAVPAVPGQGGVAASITASAAPTTYDFSQSPVSFTLSWIGVSYVISLSANYITMEGLTGEITDQLTGTGLVCVDESGKVKITERSSPWSGNSISYTVLPSSVFGGSPVVISGEPSTGGSPAVDAHIRLQWLNNTPFTGIPAGSQRMAIGARGLQYQINDIDGLTISVARLIDGVVDSSWPGFTSRTLLDGLVTGVNDDYDWAGPFLCCPDDETTDAIELNFIFPAGLAYIKSSGKVTGHGLAVIVQYRPASGGQWTQVNYIYEEKTLDEIGFTERITVEKGNYQVRVRRGDAPEGTSTRDSVNWQSMRARLFNRPSSYSDITTIALTVRTGNRLAAQTDRRVNLIGTRIYDGYQSRSISGALYHVLYSLGFSDDQIDKDTINSLEEGFWTPRGENFDYQADSDSTSALDILQKITYAGMGYFLLSDGLVSAGREGIKNWSGVISPQETTEQLQTAFLAPSDDDYDGVDVTYINGTTWAEETVQCRTENNLTPRKVETYTLDGVLSADRAYRIGMRRLMGYIHQRLTHTTSTEMDALCYQFMDRIVLTDEIPGSQTISCLVTEAYQNGEKVVLSVSEKLDWSFINPRILLRLQDGDATQLLVPTQIDDYSLSVDSAEDIRFSEWIIDDPYIEMPRLIFCSSERVGYQSLITEIAPDADGTAHVTAAQYTPLKYQYDDANYPGDIV